MRQFERLMAWLKRMPFWKAFLLAAGFLLVWGYTVGVILYLSGAKFSQHVASSESLLSNSLFMIPLTAFTEECIFRWAPMLILSFILMYLYRSKGWSKERFFLTEKYAIFILTIVSNIVFGWVHGSAWNILLQGVSGVVFMLIYLRVFFIRRDKGLRNRWQVVSLAESTLLHTVTNALLIF